MKLIFLVRCAVYFTLLSQSNIAISQEINNVTIGNHRALVAHITTDALARLLAILLVITGEPSGILNDLYTACSGTDITDNAQIAIVASTLLAALCVYMYTPDLTNSYLLKKTTRNSTTEKICSLLLRTTLPFPLAHCIIHSYDN